MILPVYNEAKRLNVNCFNEFFESDVSKETLLVFANDGSKDDTLEVLKKVMRDNKSILFDFKKNEGKAETIRKSFVKVLKDYDFESLAYLDADLSTDVYECNEMMNSVSTEKLMVFGSRISKIDSVIIRKFHRHLLGRMFATIAFGLFKLKFYDSQCGCKCFHKSVIHDLFTQKFESKWIFDVELFLRLKQKGLDLSNITAEVPLRKWVDVDGSKISLTYAFLIWVDLLKIYRRYL